MKRLIAILVWMPLFIFAEENKDEILTYEDHIKPIFREHCLKCHGDDKQKADLNLQSYVNMKKGGSGGEVVVVGRASTSLLYDSLTDPDEDSRMPPNKPPIPAGQLAMIQKWIDTGLRETLASKVNMKKRDLAFTPSTEAGAKPENPAMPIDLAEVKVPDTIRPLPVLAMDVSPWAPLVAVSGHEHVRLIHANTEEEIGRLAFPEGIPQVIRFSRDGSVLMVAGGRPVELGKVVLFDVVTGKRLALIGDEIDAVLAADLSPDQKLVALGGSGRVVKVYSTVDGSLKYKITKHTNWITSLRFSPDGKTLATADRAGGIHLWDAESGGILLTLAEHKASVRALDWRADSKLLASAGEDGLIFWWDVTDGWPVVSKANAHPPHRPEGVYGKMPNGVLAANFGADGSLVTAGRDHSLRLWNGKGASIWETKGLKQMPISISVMQGAKGNVLIAGNISGDVSFWKIDQSKENKK